MSRRRPVQSAPEVTVKQSSSSTTTDVETIVIPGVAALAAFRAAGIVPHPATKTEGMTETVTMVVPVPGGGDWSNMHLDLLEDPATLITVTITQTKRTTS